MIGLVETILHTNDLIYMRDTKMELPALTKGEESVMQILWSLGNGLVYDIIDQMSDPKPKYSTVATFIKMLQNKGYVNHSEEGRFYRYYPTVERDVYAKRVLKSVLNTYFDSSIADMVAFYAEQEKLNGEKRQELAEQISKSLGQ